MKKTFTCLLLILFISIVRYTYAQTKISSLQGKITNENYVAAEAATIVLMRYRDSASIQTTLSDKNGVFAFNNIKADKYLLQVTKTGYHKIISGPYVVSADRIIVIDSIKMQVATINLNEVVVTDKRKYYEVKPDKTILNLDRNILAAGSTVFNILNTAPGVKVSGNGDIFLRAGQRAGVFINGKQVRLEGDDLTSYLQSLPTADVDQVELIQNPSAKYDASGAGGIINIILKKGKNIGFNGNLTTNADYGTFGKGGATFNGNYRSKKLNVFGGFGYKYVKTDHTINNLRNVDATDFTTFDTHYYSTQRTPSIDYRLGTDYFINATNTIGFLIKGADENTKLNKQTNTYMAVNGAADSTITTLSNLKRKREFINYNINYAGTLGHTKQTLSADADLSILNRHNEEDIISRAYPTSTSNKPILAQIAPVYNNDTLHNSAPTRIINESIKVDYSTPIGKTGKLEAGLKASYVKSDNTQTFAELVNNIYEPVPLFTNEFTYTEKKSAAYINYKGTGNKFSYTLGLRVEHLVSDANTPTLLRNVKLDTVAFYPAVQLNYNISGSQQLSFIYNHRTAQPPYESLNPIVSYQDNYNYRSGNPYLRPAFVDHFQFSYTGKERYLISLSATTTKDFFDYSYFAQNDDAKVLVTTKRNLKRVNNFGIKLALPLQLTKWWDINFNPDFSYYQFIDYQGFLNKWSKDLILDLDQDFKISKTIAATLNTHYESSVFYGLSYNKPVFVMNPGISKRVLNKAATINLSVSDLLNTAKDRYQTMYRNLEITSYDKKETRIVHLSFVYNFGKRTVKGARKHTTGNGDEVKRMAGGGGY
jgi:iron complex outermembrane receptor protein